MATGSVMLRAITRDGSAFIHVCDSTALVAKASGIHHPSKTMTAVLGRALTGCSLMGALLKGQNNSLTLQIKGDGPAGSIVCVSDSRGNVRGYADYPQVELPPNALGKLDVGGAVGQGNLHIIKDLGMNEPYVGLCPLVSGEIAEDITEYYAKSEQIPSVCALGVRVNRDLTVKAAGGLLLQLLPGADEGVITQIEQNLPALGSVSARLAEGQTPEDLINLLFAGIPYDILDRIPVDYQCHCRREKYLSILASLNQKDKQELIDRGEDIETVCQFCGKTYRFTVQELENTNRR